MHDIRFQSPECFEEIEINTEIVSLALVQRHDFHILPHDPLPEIGVSLQTNDGMPVTLGWNMIDQVYKSIFKTPNTQVMNYMNNKRRLLSALVDFARPGPMTSACLHSGARLL